MLDWYNCMPKFVRIREIDIRESGSPKSSFIIVSSSCNVKWRSSLSSAWIVLTDLSIITFKRPMWLVVHFVSPLAKNSRHHFLTICMLITSLPYTSVRCLWISSALIFFAVKNCITVRGAHVGTYMMGSSMFGVLFSTFIWAEQPTKNSVLRLSQTEYFPLIFVAFWQFEKKWETYFWNNLL